MSSVYIIAEAGVNHNGDMTLAKKLIDEAKNAGANAVKFQTFKAEKLVTKSAMKADYQTKNDKNSQSQFEMLKKLELTYDNFEELLHYCKEVGVDFLSSAFDLESIDFLNSLGMPLFKIPSGEITNLPYLKKIALTGKQVILSTGMSTYGDIEDALEVLHENGAKDMVVLHCNTEYPTPMGDVNLRAMNSIKEAFNVEVGYSDHTEGIEIPVAAVALGGVVIEKHFTLDKNMDGPDHKASLNPKELADMVEAIRNVEKALGNGVKSLSNSEKNNLDIVRKSIIADKFIAEGDIFTEENLTVKRPGTGISPMNWESIIGKKANKSFEEDEVITL